MRIMSRIPVHYPRWVSIGACCVLIWPKPSKAPHWPPLAAIVLVAVSLRYAPTLTFLVNVTGQKRCSPSLNRATINTLGLNMFPERTPSCALLIVLSRVILVLCEEPWLAVCIINQACDIDRSPLDRWDYPFEPWHLRRSVVRRMKSHVSVLC